MKIALFYRLWFESIDQLRQAAAKKKVDLVAVQYDDLCLVQEGSDFQLKYQGKEMTDFSLFYFRAVGGSLEWAYLLLEYAKKHHIPVADEYLSFWGPHRRAKSFSGLVMGQNQVAYPKTSFISGSEQLLIEAKNYDFPFILKISTGGRHGVGTLLIDSQDTLGKVIKGRMSKSNFLIQEYIPNDGDYRLMLVGYRLLGGFKRQPKEANLVLNRSLGPSESLQEVPEQVRNLAEKAVKSLKVEIASVDMVVDSRNQQPVIIEVNEAPEYHVFQKRTNIDVPAAIIDYLVEKSRK